jgi:hypothetical protein
MKYLCLIIGLLCTLTFAQSFSKCEKIAANAVLNSDYVKNLTMDWDNLIKQNGGTSYGLQKNESVNGVFRFVLVQHYPERDYNANWFTLDVKNNQYFEESMVDPEFNTFFKLNSKDLLKLKQCLK